MEKSRKSSNPQGPNRSFPQAKKARREVDPQTKNRKEWETALCSVCMEFPHNSVLLLCSSFESGCRPYMCGTGPQFSNCLEQYQKAYAEVDHHLKEESSPPVERLNPVLLCPLCRGPVKGWTVVEPARAYFNLKRRNCVQDECLFVGTYGEMEEHVKCEHPLACPREVDPARVEKWKKLESERDRSDVMSAVRSAMPGGIVMGDYVVENGFFGGGMFTWDDVSRLSYIQVGARSSRRRGVSRMARLHERLLFGRQMWRG